MTTATTEAGTMVGIGANDNAAKTNKKNSPVEGR